MINPFSLQFVANLLTSFDLSPLHRSTPGQKVVCTQDPLAWQMRLVVQLSLLSSCQLLPNLIYSHAFSQVIVALVLMVFSNKSFSCAATNKQNLSTSSLALNLHSIRSHEEKENIFGGDKKKEAV